MTALECSEKLYEHLENIFVLETLCGNDFNLISQDHKGVSYIFISQVNHLETDIMISVRKSKDDKSDVFRFRLEFDSNIYLASYLKYRNINNEVIDGMFLEVCTLSEIMKCLDFIFRGE